MEEMLFGRRYRATEKLGSGGMAEVYKAVDEVLGRTVAVKVLHPQYAADPTFTARFRQEAQAAAQLQSPYIVNMYDWGQDGDTYYIVMEYVRGTDLKTLIQQKGALDSIRVAEIGQQVCAALSVAHGYDIIHRDIKPHNIMVTPDGSAKVMDFGIARAGNTTMTQTGSVLGTAHYVSPEQAQGRPLTPASDLYSLGVVLYEASTGRLPFEADSPVAVALKQVNDSPRSPRELNPSIDHGLEAVILTAMAKQASDRYGTADEMRRDLMRVVQGREVEATAVIPAAAPGSRVSETAVMPAVGAAAPAAAAAGAANVRPVRRRRRIWPWVLLLLLLLAGAAYAMFALELFEPPVTVPGVVDKARADAETAIVEAGLVVGEVTEQNSPDVPAGRVIDQSPVAGAPVEKGSKVDLVVSLGPTMAEVPTLIGLSEQDARDALDEAGLDGDVQTDFSDKPAGEVISQSPEAGEQVEAGSTVQYVVSRGQRTVTVPGVTGRTRGNAESALSKAGFKVSVTEAFSDTTKAGIVISQNPGKGTVTVEGSTVTIVVSKGPELIEVPDVIGTSRQEAIDTLESLGFEVDVKFEPHAENDMVLDQDPKPKSKAKRGATITILVDSNEP